MKFHGLTLRDLEYVLAVAEHGQFGRAADACAVSQPALSAQVRKVEDAVGVVIFERTPRQVRVTGRGQAVLGQVRRILAEAEVLFRLGEEGASLLTGRLRLGVIATLAPYLLPHMLAGVLDRFPKLEPVLTEGLTDDLLDRLRGGDLDAVLLSTPVADHGLEVEHLFAEPFVAAVPAGDPLGAKNRLSLEDLDTDGLILLEEGHCLRRQALELCPSNAHPSGHRLMATGLETLRQMVAAGIGHTILPALAVSGPWQAGGAMASMIRYLPIDDAPSRDIALVWRHAMPGGEELRGLARYLAEHAPKELEAAALGRAAA